MIIHFKSTFMVILMCFIIHGIKAQDPFFTHFFNNESFYNPAMVGYKGALTLNAKYKSQWASGNLPPFRSGILTFEESMPCSYFDYGLSFRFDQEGEGLFTTYDFGGRFAGTIPFVVGSSVHNVRVGASFQWTSKQVDFNRLVFSDQLDPKYGRFDQFGFETPTGFVPPTTGWSRVFFTPSIGAVYKVITDEDARKPITITLGGSLHNAYSLGADILGNVESVLGLEAEIPVRMNAFLQTEFIFFNNDYSYASITPSIFYQSQQGMQYLETGFKSTFNRTISAGVFYHNAPNDLTAGESTDWFTFLFEWGGTLGDNQRIDLGLAYSNNFSGLRNFVGPVFEVSVSFHFRQSWGCRLLGREDEVTYIKGSGGVCPTAAFSRKRKKIYENIWNQ